jgi:hypothetical protein
MLVERRCGIQIDGRRKHRLPLSSHGRCLSCGTSDTTPDEEEDDGRGPVARAKSKEEK